MINRAPLHPWLKSPLPLDRWFGLLLALVLGVLIALAPGLAVSGPLGSKVALTKRMLHEPSSCLLGAYIQDMRDYQFAQNSLFASIRLWSVCPSQDETPLANLSVLNANSIQLGEIKTEKLPNKSNYYRNDQYVYWSERTAEGTFFNHWSAKNFPFDRHTIRFEFEALNGNSNSFVFTPDYRHSGFNPSINNADWIAKDFVINEGNHQYSTNFGRPDKGQSKDDSYSRVTVEITLQRARVTSFLKLCAGVYAAVAIAGMAFMLDMREPDIVSGRTGLLVGCLFAAIVNMQQAASTLGMSEDVTLTDSIHVVAILYILVASILAIVSYLRAQAGGEDSAQRMDRKIYLPIYMYSYIVVNFLMISYAAVIG